MSGRARIPVQGEIPNPIDPPPGCSFHPRCPEAFARCRVEVPELPVPAEPPRCLAVEIVRLPWTPPSTKFACKVLSY